MTWNCSKCGCTFMKDRPGLPLWKKLAYRRVAGQRLQSGQCTRYQRHDGTGQPEVPAGAARCTGDRGPSLSAVPLLSEGLSSLNSSRLRLRATALARHHMVVGPRMRTTRRSVGTERRDDTQGLPTFGEYAWHKSPATRQVVRRTSLA